MTHVTVQMGRGTAAQIAAYVGLNAEVAINTDDGSLVIFDGVITGGKYRIPSQPAGSGNTYSAPATGATITAAAGDRRLIIDPAGTIAALTVVLPSSPKDGDVYELSTSQVITALTVNGAGGATVNGGSLSPGANTGFSWLYRATGTKWFRRY